MILNYLKCNYKLAITGYEVAIVDLDGYSMLYHKIYQQLHDVFGFTDVNYTEIVSGWYENLKSIFLADFTNFMSGYSVELRLTDWAIVDRWKQEANIEMILNELANYYDTEEIVKHFLEEWKLDKIITVSERIMGIN